MQTKRKIVSIALGLMITASLLSGCGKGAGSNSLDFSNATLSGTITAIDENKVTIAMSGGFGGGRMGNRGNNEDRSNQEKQTREGSTDTSQSTEETLTPPEMPDGLTSPEIPNGDAPTNMPKGEMPNNATFRNMLSQGNSTFTLTITDESVLEDCTMDDIAEGSFITITLGNNNTITSITVMKLTNNQAPSESTKDENEI